MTRALMPALVALVTLVAACREDAFCLVCDPAGSGGRGGSADSDRDGGGSGGEGGAGDDGGTSGDGGGAGDTGPTGCLPLGAEVCNAIDDDCDGTADEDFDFTSSPLHCGGCDQLCQGQNAATACEDGQCVVEDCLSGYANLDADEGCEYRCPRSPTAAEDCNGIDDDCDGRSDESVVAPDPGILCKRVPGTPCADVGVVCAEREGSTTWFCDYPSSVDFDRQIPDGIVPEELRCDGLDNDCDGVADDAWQDELDTACDSTGVGACAGIVRCKADATDTECTPRSAGAGPDSVELCNGIDDNCDGMVDNGARDELVHVQRTLPGMPPAALDFYIYKYEASRPDASTSSAGTSNARACSKPNAQPWSFVQYSTAASACAAAGLRLCSAAEWQVACIGDQTVSSDEEVYPYGSSYQPDTCNGTNHDAIAGGEIDNAVVATGTLAQCRSTDDVFDLSGNLKEWTSEQPDPMQPMIRTLRGGSYLTPQLGLTCQTNLSRASTSTLLANVGFRCCATTLPQ